MKNKLQKSSRKNDTKLSSVLKDRGITAYRLSKITGISLRACYYYASGERTLDKASYIHIKKITEALDVEAQDIMEG